MDKVVLISAFISLAAANDVLKYEPQRPLDLQQNQFTSPPFCNSLKCPEYKVITNGKGFEERLYSQSQWVSTNLTGVDYSQATRPMFMKLFKYISGANEQKQKVKMTAPVRTRIVPGPGPACESDFIMSFYVAPGKDQPPVPTDKAVYLETVEETTLYVRQFGGRMRTFDEWSKEAMKLAADLEEAKLSYDDKRYFLAGYDSPFRLFNRHNEVWFVKA